MSRSRNNKKRPKAQGPRVAPEVFPELNASFYTANPAEFILMRIEALSLMAAPEPALREAFASERRIGSVALGRMPVPDEERRQRYIATESVLIVHHAAEMLLRLYFAHVEKQDCPWLGMASSVNFAEFKDKLTLSLRSGFDSDDVARTFLGGTSPSDAGIRVTDEDFVENVEAIQLLMDFATQRMLTESFLYNAAKHGLTTVQLDDSTRMVMESPMGERVEFMSGRLLAYLHKPRFPGAKTGTEWHISMTGSLPDQDLAVATLIQRAIHSLWTVAKRRYTEESGEVHLFTRQGINDVIYAPVLNSLNVVRTVVYELPKRDAEGNISGIELDFKGQNIPDDWERLTEGYQASGVRRIFLAIRQRDRQPINPSSRSLLPFSPRQSSRI